MSNEEILLEHLTRHLGALAVQYVLVDQVTGNESDEAVATYTGFFISWQDQWFFVTAGHSFLEDGRGIHDLQRNGRIRVVQSSLSDFFRESALHRNGIPVDFDSLPIHAVYDQDAQLDFAFIELRQLYVDALRANQVTPISESNIRADHDFPELRHGVLGFPDENTASESDEHTITTWLEPAFAFVERLPLDSAEARKYPDMISARILADSLRSPVGLSGGAFFALTRLDDGNTGYWLIGIQSRWDPNTRTLYACPIHRALEQLNASQS